MRRLRGAILGVLVALSAAGCEDRLVVTNTNNPDRDRALNRPTDVENLALAQYRIVHNAWWNVTNLEAQMNNMSFQSFSANANFGMNVRSGIPRSLIDNGRGNPADFYGSFLSWNQAARAAALALSKLNETTFTFFPADVPRVRAARAFGYFTTGVAMGYLAMSFDSSSIITPDDDPEADNPLVDYNTLMTAALADLDQALAISSSGTTADITTGIQGLTLTSNATRTGSFQRLIYAHKARFRAGVARTPAERAAVNWAAVLADADSGPTANVSATMSSGSWNYRPMQMDLFQSWHRMPQFMVGMADTSGRYVTWLGTARANKDAFVVATPDRRFPSGTTRAAQQTSSGCTAGTCLQPTATAPYPYFRNRPTGEDVGVDGIAHSYYDYYRFQSFWNANRNGSLIIFARAELDLLAAEALLRAGNIAGAAARIDITRVPNGLPALVGAVTSLNDPVPGGTACVPLVPTGAMNALAETPTATACGNIMEALKWEKRLETAYINPAAWFFDGRGWGDLVAGTQTQFPVPYTDLDARRIPIYSGGAMNAAVSVASASYTAAERLQPATNPSTSNYGLGHY